jgi:tetratricopeptide (TPR) repeat protein
MQLYRQAVPLYERAIEIREANVGPEHVTVSLGLHNLAEALRRQGRPKEAIVSFERALAIKEGHYEAGHGSIALTLTGLGRARLDAGDTRGALDALTRALEIRRARAAGTAPEDLAEVLFAVATALDLAGEARDGLEPGALAHEAQTLFERAGPAYVGERAEVGAWLALHAAVHGAPRE